MVCCLYSYLVRGGTKYDEGAISVALFHFSASFYKDLEFIIMVPTKHRRCCRGCVTEDTQSTLRTQGTKLQKRQYLLQNKKTELHEVKNVNKLRIFSKSPSTDVKYDYKIIFIQYILRRGGGGPAKPLQKGKL
jgi:hypothetical protein